MESDKDSNNSIIAFDIANNSAAAFDHNVKDNLSYSYKLPDQLQVNILPHLTAPTQDSSLGYIVTIFDKRFVKPYPKDLQNHVQHFRLFLQIRLLDFPFLNSSSKNALYCTALDLFLYTTKTVNLIGSLSQTFNQKINLQKPRKCTVCPVHTCLCATEVHPQGEITFT